jgi:hypothetical protein
MEITRVTTRPPANTPKPNPGGQTGFAADWDHRFIAAEGGWGSGKTWIGCRKLLTLHVHNAYDRATGEPTFVPSAMLGPTYRNLWDVGIPMMEATAEECGIAIQIKSSSSQIIFPDFGTKEKPSEIKLRSADKPELITGWEVGAFWGDEPTRWRENRINPKGDPFIQILGRLRHPRAKLWQGMFTYTNEGDGTRVYEEFNAGKPDYALYRLPTWENPTVKEFYEAQMRILTEDLAKQYLGGEAISLRGKFAYGVYRPEINDDPEIRVIPNRRLAVCVDFNIRPGMYFGLGHYLEDRDLFLAVTEVHQPDLDIRQGIPLVAAEIGRVGGIQRFGGSIDLFGDATGRSRWVGTSETCYDIVRQCFDSAGLEFTMRVPSENPPEMDRVNALNVSLMDVAGGVHFLLNPENCPILKRDLQQVRWNDKGTELEKKANPLLTHASDAWSYKVHYQRPARIKEHGPMGQFGV